MISTPPLDRESAPHSRLVGQDCIAIGPSDSVRVVENLDGAVLLDIQQGLCFSMNSVGALIWKRLADGSSPAEIADNLSRTFSISYEQAWGDVQEFVEEMKQRHLLKPIDNEEVGSRRLRWLSGIVSGLWNRRWQWNAKSTR